MRIGFFTDTYIPQITGIGFVVHDLKRELEALGHEVYIIAPAPSLRYKESDPHIIRYPALKGVFLEDYMAPLFFPPQALRRIKALKLDLIQFYTPSQIGLMGIYAASTLDIPLVSYYSTDLFEYIAHYPHVLPGILGLTLLAPITIRGQRQDFKQAFLSLKPEPKLDLWGQKIVVKMMTVVHNHCDRIIAPSPKIKQQLLSWKTQTGIEIIPAGVDRLPISDQSIKDFTNRFGIQPEDKIILHVSRVSKEKNVELLIKAFGIVAQHDRTSKLLIVGDSPHRATLMDLTDSLDLSAKVIFSGMIDHHVLGSIYALGQVFAYPSITDTQCLTLNEAAGAGLPIVMADPEITEVVKDRINGLVAQNNPADFASKLLTILKSAKKRQAMSAASTQLAAKFSTRTQALKLLEVYQDVIGQHPKRSRSKWSAAAWIEQLRSSLE